MSGGGARRAVGAGEGEPERGGENQKKHLRSPPRRFLDKNPPSMLWFSFEWYCGQEIGPQDLGQEWRRRGGRGRKCRSERERRSLLCAPMRLSPAACAPMDGMVVGLGEREKEMVMLRVGEGERDTRAHHSTGSSEQK